MIAQKYLKFAQFIDKRATLEEAPEVFAEMSDDPLIYVCPIIKVL